VRTGSSSVFASRGLAAALPVVALAAALTAGEGVAAPAGPARPAASGARVDVYVVGRSRVLAGPATVAARAATVRVGGRRCAAGAGTPLAALLARARGRLRVGLRDYGSCSRRAADAGQLFVTRVGADRNRGRDGWVYKVGHRVGTAGAADPAGPFGAGRLRGGGRLTWMWCRMRVAGCQRTLEITVPRRVAPGAAVRVRVRGYDDRAHAMLVAGAAVRLGASAAMTDRAGFATLRAPARPGAARVTASSAGTVPAFPERVTVR
jgi:hypothetical protein